MQLTSNDPRTQGRIDGRLAEIENNGFELVESAQFPGHYFETRCKRCGKKYKIAQHIRRFRHKEASLFGQKECEPKDAYGEVAQLG